LLAPSTLLGLGSRGVVGRGGGGAGVVVLLFLLSRRQGRLGGWRFAVQVLKPLLDIGKGEVVLRREVVDDILVVTDEEAEEEGAFGLIFVQELGEGNTIRVLGGAAEFAEAKPFRFEGRDKFGNRSRGVVGVRQVSECPDRGDKGKCSITVVFGTEVFPHL